MLYFPILLIAPYIYYIVAESPRVDIFMKRSN